ncbi:MAG: 3' terminal RNA ribose 2'-O-methyltransferase Hen1, partial [Desulfobacteraceae bacterium]|nr:3' terminal RNA ribose 2'-O-methyltransferase Hen1 [Desulfobacteraceae bacterium]
MLLSITTTNKPATDLGYLLHKNPAKVQTFELGFGNVHVFYPHADDDLCMAVMLLDIDPVGLIRGRKGLLSGHPLKQYVNDRPYAASSFMSVAISRVYGTALSGRCRERPGLAEKNLSFIAKISALPCRGGEAFLYRLFEPLGYEVSADPHMLPLSADAGSEDDDSPYYTVELRAKCRLKDLLSHLYVLIPVLDNDKHYWVGEDEVAKLLRQGKDWLADHPEKERIANRYLKHKRTLARLALARLIDEHDPGEACDIRSDQEEQIEKSITLNDQRMAAVVNALKKYSAKKVLDLGCGEGRLIRELLKHEIFEQITGLDVSWRTLEIAKFRLRFDRMPDKQKKRLKLFHGSLTYRDKRLTGYDAAAVLEVIEHLDPERLT